MTPRDKPRYFLYLTPPFPPLSWVGALRPLKFIRHLSHHGWTPVVLCDLQRKSPVDWDLLEAVPEGIPVIYDYTRRAAPALDRLKHRPPGNNGGSRSESWIQRVLPNFLTNPEKFPFGDHGPHILYSIRAAERVLANYPCEAILANASPYEALYVGAKIARRTRLPLVLDLRDPWSICELRRPMRPAPTRWLVDRIERTCVETADKVILNTETALAEYRSHYRHIDPGRFTVIPNHSDPALIANGPPVEFDRFTVLFLGRFRRFLDGRELLEVFAELKRRGVSAEDIQLVVTDRFPPSVWRKACAMGIEKMIRQIPHVPYRSVGSIMEASDLLFVLSNRARHRIPAKLYDYLLSRRPIHIMADNLELELLGHENVGIRMTGIDAVGETADGIRDEMKAGRQRDVGRRDAGLSSVAATELLAHILNEATSGSGS